MTRSFREYELGARGADYVDARLRAGNTLARAIESRFSAFPKKCITHLPDDVQSGAYFRFSEGGVGDASESELWLVGIIEGFLLDDPYHLVVIEDALAIKGDPTIGDLPSRVRFFGSEVYHILSRADANEYSIRTTISEATSPHQLNCVFTQRWNEESGDPSTITQAEMKAWIDCSIAIAVMAYDGEGYIFCSSLMRGQATTGIDIIIPASGGT